MAEEKRISAQIHSSCRNNEVDIGGNVHDGEPDVLRTLLFQNGFRVVCGVGWSASFVQAAPIPRGSG